MGRRQYGHQCPPLDPNNLTPTWANSLTPGHEVSPVRADRGTVLTPQHVGHVAWRQGQIIRLIPDPIPQCLYTGFLIPGSMISDNCPLLYLCYRYKFWDQILPNRIAIQQRCNTEEAAICRGSDMQHLSFTVFCSSWKVWILCSANSNYRPTIINSWTWIFVFSEVTLWRLTEMVSTCIIHDNLPSITMYIVDPYLLYDEN